MHQLLAHLATWPQNGRFQKYAYQQIGGGANNILYKVSGEDGTFAVKFTLRDGRRQAWREFQALTALQAHGLAIAPEPILLDEDSYPQPVVVQTWLDGEVTAVTRIQTYYPLMLIWWVARLARALYEIPRGQDQRLAPRDPDWQQQGEQKLAYYIQRAFAVMSLRNRSAYG